MPVRTDWSIGRAICSVLRVRAWLYACGGSMTRFKMRGNGIGELRIPTPLYNIYLAEADELSRHLHSDIHDCNSVFRVG